MRKTVFNFRYFLYGLRIWFHNILLMKENISTSIVVMTFPSILGTVSTNKLNQQDTGAY